MLRFVVGRLLTSVFVLAGISVLMFSLLRLMPGSPAEVMLDPFSFQGDRQAALDQISERLGLNQPLPVQYLIWLKNLLGGNLGYSYADGRPVAEVLLARLGPTAELMFTGLMMAIIAGVSLGVLAAARQNSWIDHLATSISLLAISVPSFFLALGAIYVVGLKLAWLPTSGMASTTGAGPLDALTHLVLPASTLGFTLTGAYVRYARASMIEVLEEDYLTTASAKGLRRSRIILRHALPNALIPLISVVAIQVPVMFAGAVIIEQLFAWPGMGRMALDAILARNYPLLLGFVMIVSILVLLCNLIADVSYAAADPRIRAGRFSG